MRETIFNMIISSPFFVFLPIAFIFLKHMGSLYWRRGALPPGPKPWPLIGNFLQLRGNLRMSVAKFAQVHGTFISLRLGTQTVIVASSASAAAEILKNHDRLLSSGYITKAVPRQNTELERIALISNPTCSDHWKLLRSLSRSELFSAKAIESHASLREKKMMEMIGFLDTKQGEVVNIGKTVYVTVFNALSNLLFSKDFMGMEDEERANGLKSLFWKSMELATTPNIAEVYPTLDWLAPQGLKRNMSRCLEEIFRVREINIKKRRARAANDASITDFLDVLLANGFDDDQIDWFVTELLGAATDTTAATIECAMAEILKNKQVMKKVEEELDREINRSTIHESQVCQLPYLNACIKETLRLHPPAPFLLPRRALETCEIMNYKIPKNTQIPVNAWAIGRDPSAWKDPLTFKPERFLGSTTVSLKGRIINLYLLVQEGEFAQDCIWLQGNCP